MIHCKNYDEFHKCYTFFSLPHETARYENNPLVYHSETPSPSKKDVPEEVQARIPFPQLPEPEEVHGRTSSGEFGGLE